jgi:hypothetical protein
MNHFVAEAERFFDKGRQRRVLFIGRMNKNSYVTLTKEISTSVPKRLGAILLLRFAAHRLRGQSDP